MKNLIILGSLFVLTTACNNTKTADIESAKQAVIDSVNQANELQAIKQRTIDSMTQVANEQEHSHVSSQSSNETVATTASGKKKMSNKTKGALIGTGAGIIGGAIAGAVLDKENPAKGAVIGGAVGGAVGSGVGYGAGAAKDKKAAKTQTTTTKP